MQGISQAGWQLLSRFERKRSPLDHLLARRSWDLEVLEELEALRNPVIVPFLAPALLLGSEEERAAVRGTVARVLEGASDLFWMDDDGQRHSFGCPSTRKTNRH